MVLYREHSHRVYSLEGTGFLGHRGEVERGVKCQIVILSVYSQLVVFNYTDHVIGVAFTFCAASTSAFRIRTTSHPPQDHSRAQEAGALTLTVPYSHSRSLALYI